MKNQKILLRYHEIAIKGKNRQWFETHLAQNAKILVARALAKDLESKSEESIPIHIQRFFGRIVLETPWNSVAEEALTRVFGLSSFSPIIQVPTDQEAILKAALAVFRDAFQYFMKNSGVPRSFRVKTRRSDKVLVDSSMEMDRSIGSAIHDKYPSLQVDLKKPDLTLAIEIRSKVSFISISKIQASGGLPVGTHAPSLSLLSGGLDSPVAALQILRRGSPLTFLHFYGTPFVGEEILEKIEDQVRLINHYQPDPKPLYIVPFGKIQEKIALLTPPNMRTLLYRRMMIRIANRLANQLKLLGLVTGESLGQVASQTLENLASINAVAELPVLRPLIAYDKADIISLAQKWKSFEISIRPAIDCCTLFADRHPLLRSTSKILEYEEQKWDVESLVQEALSGMFERVVSDSL